MNGNKVGNKHSSGTVPTFTRRRASRPWKRKKLNQEDHAEVPGEAAPSAEEEAAPPCTDSFQDDDPQLSSNFSVPLASAHDRGSNAGDSKWDEVEAIFPGGRLRLDSVLDLLVEHASEHNLSRKCMQGLVDIINLLLLDGGAADAVIPRWDTIDRRMRRQGQQAVKYYYVCPWECDSGCMEMKNSTDFPKYCISCGKRNRLTPTESKQFTLRHIDLGTQLRAVLKHPGPLFMSLTHTLLIALCLQMWRPM